MLIVKWREACHSELDSESVCWEIPSRTFGTYREVRARVSKSDL